MAIEQFVFSTEEKAMSSFPGDEEFLELLEDESVASLVEEDVDVEKITIDMLREPTEEMTNPEEAEDDEAINPTFGEEEEHAAPLFHNSSGPSSRTWTSDRGATDDSAEETTIKIDRNIGGASRNVSTFSSLHETRTASLPAVYNDPDDFGELMHRSQESSDAAREQRVRQSRHTRRLPGNRRPHDLFNMQPYTESRTSSATCSAMQSASPREHMRPADRLPIPPHMKMPSNTPSYQPSYQQPRHQQPPLSRSQHPSVDTDSIHVTAAELLWPFFRCCKATNSESEEILFR